ncbi:MAG: hypothetical protein ACERKV_06380 [Clostridiaceae bacterium]
MNVFSNQNVLKEYLDYSKSEEATIVYFVKNLVNNLDTKNKWVDVVNFDIWGSKDNKPAFNYIIVKLFEKRIYPKYPKEADLQLRKAITWATSHHDIEQQKVNGIRGQMFLITCYLYDENKGKKEIKYFDNWNEEYGGYDFTGISPTTTISRKVSLQPKWKYKITGKKEIDDSRYQYIKENYHHIYSRILDEKRVKIDWFFENYSGVKKHHKNKH